MSAATTTANGTATTEALGVLQDGRCYLSGGMSGLPDLNFPTFHRAAAHLRSHGVTVVSPAELDSNLEQLPGESDSDHWCRCISRDILSIVGSTTRSIVLLPGWRSSRGATLETYIAASLGRNIVSITHLESEPRLRLMPEQEVWERLHQN